MKESMGTFGVLLEYFWGTFGQLRVPHLSLVFMTVASFLLLRAHVATTARSSMPNPASCMIKTFRRGGGGGGEGWWMGRGSSEGCLKWGGGGSLKDLSKTS